MTGRACGKVILLGEHAVVYGVPALAVGIDRGARADARTIDMGHSKGSASARSTGLVSTLRIEGGAQTSTDAGDDLGRAFSAIVEAASSDGREPQAFEVVASTDLPPGAGLGCSAALGVAIGRALGEARGEAPDLERSVALAMAWERVFHGNPSGVDAAVAARGGAVRFVRGEAPEPLRLRKPLTIAIGNTGHPSSTKAMVEAVARLRDRRPGVFEKSLDGIRSLVGNARLALEAGDLRALGQLMDLNQMLLAGMGLSNDEIERLCALGREAGALGCKLTGAGGGGCVVALCDGDADPLVSTWRAAGFEAFAASVGAVPSDEVEEKSDA